VPDAEIRPLTPGDDMDAQLDLAQRAFGVYPLAQRESWSHLTSLRISQGMFLGAFVAGQPVGAGILHDMRQWWHGRAVRCVGVGGVKVAPEQRGKGVGRRLMTAVLELIAERGYPLSALYPATMPLYRSLGWELAGGQYQATVPARSLRSLMPPDAASAAGSGAPAPDVRRAGRDDAAAVNEVIGRCHQAARDCGPLTWDLGPTARWLSEEDMYAYLTDDGFAAYRWDDGTEILFVERVHGASRETVRALWSVIASHAPVADTIRARIAPADPFWWLTHERDAALTKRSMWMLRVVDAPAAIAARGFPAAVSVTVPLVIRDHTRPGNSGRWELTVTDGSGILIPNAGGILPAAPPALQLGARGLAALYAGTPVAALRLAGLASGGSPDTDAALDAAFAATAYMLDDF
jgi:predicted acetyltransferase